jgi:hypothetical protein
VGGHRWENHDAGRVGQKKKNGRPYLKITEAKEILLGGVK